MPGIGDDERADSAAHDGEQFVRRRMNNRGELATAQHIAAERTDDNYDEANKFHGRAKEILSLSLARDSESGTVRFKYFLWFKTDRKGLTDCNYSFIPAII